MDESGDVLLRFFPLPISFRTLGWGVGGNNSEEGAQGLTQAEYNYE